MFRALAEALTPRGKIEPLINIKLSLPFFVETLEKGDRVFRDRQAEYGKPVFLQLVYPCL